MITSQDSKKKSADRGNPGCSNVLLRIFSHGPTKVLLKFFGSVAVHFSEHELVGNTLLQF